MISFLSITDENFYQVLSSQFLQKNFGLTEEMANYYIENDIKKHLDRLKRSIKILIESNYVDKVYRDSYYTYYASKKNEYNRNCIRLSFFEDEENQMEDIHTFRNASFKQKLSKNYRGFFILRPTIPYIVGRSAISPSALTEHNFVTCMTSIPSTAMGLKFSVSAFPYSSQDTETISCAETMIWALMEYFGNKYPEYSPILPSRIHNVLKSNIFERQLPSCGLPIDSMSFMLKECNFGPKIYSKKEFKEDFPLLLNCYIESGIPLIVALDNTEEYRDSPDFIGHAVLCVGRATITTEDVKNGKEKILYTRQNKQINLYDWDNINKKLVFIDDNYPVYQNEYIETPADRYEEKKWKACKISHFIVPLYKKIYLEAHIAKTIVEKLLLSNYCLLGEGKELYIRTFLCSTRSYREYVMLSDMDNKLKDIIIFENMPKFIWVTEISDKRLLNQNKANGLIILDATEANEKDLKPVILCLCNGYLITYNKNKKSLGQIPWSQSEFMRFENNLKLK